MKSILLLLLFSISFPLFSQVMNFNSEIEKKMAHKNLQWKRLLHYKYALIRERSNITDKKFFLSSAGELEPKTELKAIIKNLIYLQRNTIQCHYPARVKWLGKQMKLPEGSLNFKVCPEYLKFKKKYKLSKASLFYVIEPTTRSLFDNGTIQIKFESYNKKRRRKDKWILDFETTEKATYSNITIGSRLGQYKIKKYDPYFAPAKDLWQYDLNLSRYQKELFIDHLWELTKTHSRLSSVHKNQSYRMFSFIEALFPTVDIISETPHYSLNIDFLKILVKSKYKNKRVISKIQFFPSSKDLFMAYIKELNNYEQGLFFKFVENFELPTKKMKKKSIRNILQASEYYEKIHPNVFLAQAINKYRKTPFNKIIQVPPHKIPHNAHGSQRVKIGVGNDQSLDFFTELNFRYGIHDLLDDTAAYPILSSINFLDISFNYFEETSKFDFYKIKIYEIEKLKTFSYKSTFTFYNELSHSDFTNNFGYTKRFLDHHLFTLYLSTKYTSNIKHSYLYTGPLFQFLFHWNNKINNKLELYYLKSVANSKELYGLKQDLRWNLEKEMALQILTTVEKSYHQNSVNLLFYF
ncbi:MAG: hypothetical protein ACI9QD_000401 [Thermoproteota archaeon]|jgi:hypothetical protein